jgi:hypothetical protein
MDEILRDSARRERATNIKLGLFLVVTGAAIAIGAAILLSGPGLQIYVLPTGVISYGLFRLGRGLAGKSAD